MKSFREYISEEPFSGKPPEQGKPIQPIQQIRQPGEQRKPLPPLPPMSTKARAMRPEDKKSFETETGAYHSGARAADYSRLNHLRTPHKYIHSETGKDVHFYHPNAVRTTNLSPEEKEAFRRGYDDQTNHPNDLFGEKDRN